VNPNGKDGGARLNPSTRGVKNTKHGDANQKYPLVNQHNYGKSPFFMGKFTINGDVP